MHSQYSPGPSTRRNNNTNDSLFLAIYFRRYIILEPFQRLDLHAFLYERELINTPYPSNRNHGFHTRSLQGFGHRPPSSLILSRAGPRPAPFQDGAPGRRWTAFSAKFGSHKSAVVDVDAEFFPPPQRLAATTTWPVSTRLDRVLVELSTTKVRLGNFRVNWALIGWWQRYKHWVRGSCRLKGVGSSNSQHGIKLG